ncbi:MAG: LysE family translocator, partial [Propionivibrio sp.]|uniref:LysE family translocator n=1 Tax=Propionivibrio sp. TaxID=2212460 RepID=UPI001B59B2BC
MIDLPLLTYMATMSVTPGPNNLMLAASGVNFGFRRTLPHMLGISIGVGIQIVLVAGLLAWVMTWLDALRLPLVFVGCAYLLWLARRQAGAGQPGNSEKRQPLGFFGAALFQWVNPKAWMMVLNAAILFLPHGNWTAVLWMAVMSVFVNLPCIAVWAFAGDKLRFKLRDPLALRVFNYTMATLLAATALWIM